MRLLVTGAGGFLGRRVVAAALARGHSVRAVLRASSAPAEWSQQDPERLEVVRHDLRRRDGNEALVRDVDTVLHLAAATSGDVYDQYGSTVVGTENLLAALLHAAVRRFVLVSSIAIYDFEALKAGAVLDETAALESRPARRDAYVQAKLAQERLVREHAAGAAYELVVLRPGVILGPEKPWTPRLGFRTSRLWWQVGWGRGQVPVIGVESCALAVVLAAEAPGVVGQTFNLVDAPAPTPRDCLRFLAAGRADRPIRLRLPWRPFAGLARLADGIDRRFFAGRLKRPELLHAANVHARFKPLRYDARHLRQALAAGAAGGSGAAEPAADAGIRAGRAG